MKALFLQHYYMDIKEYINSLNVKKGDIHSIIRKILIENERKILRIIRTRLYQQGIDGTGNKISPEYSEMTKNIKLKSKPRQITSHVTLRNSGDFYANMNIDYNSGYLFIGSSVPYESDLVAMYGESILDLTEPEIEFIIDFIIEPELLKELKINQTIVIDF